MPEHASHDDRLHHDRRGDGDPVVVLGGGPARHPDYLGDLAGLGRDRALIVPHLRGIGRSPLPADPRLASWWRQAEDVEALREHLGLATLTVVGHSAGTRIALAFAARFPASVARLVLITPPAADLVDVQQDVPGIRGRRAGEPAWEAALALAQQGPPADADAEGLTAWQQRIAPLSYARWDGPQQAHALVGGWNPAAVAAYDSVAAPATFAADLAAVRSPVRVIAAAEDGVVGTAAPLALAELFPDGRGAVVDGAGHYPWIDRPEEFLEAARDALRS